MKSLEDWLRHLEGLHPKGQAGIELGLERVVRVKAALRQAQHCPVIVVGGTNGKGSTCAYLEAIYRAEDYRVGCYTSPHLLAYNERVRVDGVPVEDAALCAAFARVEAARQAAGGIALTYFEFGTLAAWEVFAAANVQVAILEVGLGGRLDAVNVYDADVAIVTGIALDHTDWLGPTREHIGREKAGIFRAGRPAICADPAPPESLQEVAQSLGADLFLLGRDFGATRDTSTWRFWSRAGSLDALPSPSLIGAWQFGNAAAALLAVERLQARLPVTYEAVCAGLRGARATGRFQQVRARPSVILDVAHNPQATGALADNLAAAACAGRTLAVVGMLADKDVDGALAPLAGFVDEWLLADLDGPRGATAERLAGVVAARALGGNVQCFGCPQEAFRYAVGVAGEDDRIAAFGSFLTVAAVLREIARDG